MAFNPNLLIKQEPSSLFTQPSVIPSIIPLKAPVSLWTYQAGTDTSATVNSGIYFTYFADWQNTLIYDNGQFLNVGDYIFCACSDTPIILVVTSVGQFVTTMPYSTTPGGTFIWNTAIANTIMQPDNGYIIMGAGLLTMTLPPVCPVGSIIRISGTSAAGWTIAQNALQVIHFGDDDSTIGVGGSLSSELRYDTVELLCTIANTNFVVQDSLGNLTII